MLWSLSADRLRSSAIGLAVILLMVGISGCSETAESSLGSVQQEEGSSEKKSPTYSVTPDEMLPAEVASRLEVAALETLSASFGGELDVSLRTQLAKEYGAAIERYVLGDAADFLAHLEKSETLTDSDRKAFETQWKLGASVVSMAPMDDSMVSVNVAMVGGETVDGRPRLGSHAVQGSRRGANGIDDPRAQGFDVIEIVVPMKIRPMGADPVDGKFGLSFAFDHNRGEWVLVGLGVGQDGDRGVLTVPPI